MRDRVSWSALTPDERYVLECAFQEEPFGAILNGWAASPDYDTHRQCLPEIIPAGTHLLQLGLLEVFAEPMEKTDTGYYLSLTDGLAAISYEQLWWSKDDDRLTVKPSGTAFYSLIATDAGYEAGRTRQSPP